MIVIRIAIQENADHTISFQAHGGHVEQCTSSEAQLANKMMLAFNEVADHEGLDTIPARPFTIIEKRTPGPDGASSRDE